MFFIFFLWHIIVFFNVIYCIKCNMHYIYICVYYVLFDRIVSFGLKITFHVRFNHDMKLHIYIPINFICIEFSWKVDCMRVYCWRQVLFPLYSTAIIINHVAGKQKKIPRYPSAKILVTERQTPSISRNVN